MLLVTTDTGNMTLSALFHDRVARTSTSTCSSNGERPSFRVGEITFHITCVNRTTFHG